MSLIVKICGLSTEDTVDAALDAGADMVGFNFFAKSPRFLTADRAAALARRARGRGEITAVVVDMDDAALEETVETVRPDWLQLHGSETVERVADVRKRFDVKVMKAIGVRDKRDLEAARPFRNVADRLLLDVKAPKDADRPGGLGQSFDWRLLAGFDAGIPYLLAGGLDPGNVAEAIRISGAPGVDVSSGVETAPGRKDADLIRAFIAAARRAEAALATASKPEKVAS